MNVRNSAKGLHFSAFIVDMLLAMIWFLFIQAKVHCIVGVNANVAFPFVGIALDYILVSTQFALTYIQVHVLCIVFGMYHADIHCFVMH